jgi:hypothetical protein
MRVQQVTHPRGRDRLRAAAPHPAWRARCAPGPDRDSPCPAAGQPLTRPGSLQNTSTWASSWAGPRVLLMCRVTTCRAFYRIELRPVMTTGAEILDKILGA